MKRFLYLIWMICGYQSVAQNWQGSLEAQINLNNHTPYWMRANKFGSVPLSGASTSLIAGLKKDYKDSKLDWGFSAEVRGDLGKTAALNIIEGHVKVKWSFLEIRAGRTKEFLGLIDSTLSLGSFSYSGTALGIPKIEIRIPEYWPKRSLISFRGNYAHGWYGYYPTKGTLAEIDSLYTYFHQKSVWIRLAKPTWKLKLYGGMVDNAFWGDEYKLHSSFQLSKAQRYWSVISGKNWQDSKVGNHVGNFDIRAEYKLGDYQIALYRQFFYEVGALWHLANISDGLLGMSVINHSKEYSNHVHWNKLLFEVLYTKNQAGEPWSKPTPTGNENYLNHYLYNLGWSYKDNAIGQPMVTPRYLAKDDLPYEELEYFVNNRLWSINFGGEYKVKDWSIENKVTYSKNFGTRKTEKTFPISNQFSWIINAEKSWNKEYQIGLELAGDQGQLLPNSYGAMLKVRRTF